ncbi:sigma-70 family RNA polymerase sigma factor [Flaviflexus equikiangi]|uniref:sigma-70 family RNA polymerase sigma factor n=1 Tax=Flaviflexus equikiangi TaxID=2758573 RepID=UPI0015F6CC3A|nr:sigma-70 family RNA polymerase sigma factor [Flaviflexus equikiangi]
MTCYDPAEGAPPGSPDHYRGNDAGPLITQIAGGDRAAFNELYRSTGAMLLAVILRVVRDRDLAEEVLHECFTYVWTNAHTFDHARGSGHAWLVTLARRRAIDCVRSVESQRNRDTSQGIREVNLHEPAHRHSYVEAEVETRIESARAATALRTLPEEQGRVLALVYYEGLTQQQAAERTGIPLGTVKTRIREGLRKLREDMEGAR